jgi:actin-related protein
MAEIMFESQKVCGYYHMHQSVLSLFASGRTRGIVVEIGHGSSHVTPIFEGYALPHASLHYNIGGVDISQRLQKILAKRGHSFHSLHIQTINDIKENNCYVGARGEKFTNNNSSEDSKSFELPDGTILTLDKQARMSPPEIIFKPQDLGDDHGSRPSKGLHEFFMDSISMCDKDLQKDLYDSVILAGGSTMMPGNFFFYFFFNKE